MSVSNEWCLYVLECADQSLYIGITNNMEKRLTSHQEGKGGKYTRSRLPVKLASCWRFDCDRSFISKLEKRVKSMNHSRRLDLVQNPALLEKYIDCVKLPIENSCPD